jgi:hypothetical protein
VHPSLVQYDDSLREGQSGYFRADLSHAEYIALPALANGFYDHSLELGLSLGYISRDIAFLPFMGGGQLYALSAPEYNTSVGFVGYPLYSVRSETLANLSVTYRGPIARRLGFDWCPLYLEDIYFQVFTPSTPRATIADGTLLVAFLGPGRIELDPLRADYLVVDLWQALTPVVSEDADGGVPAAETEAIVRLTVPTDGAYAAGGPLVTDAAGKGCWSAARPLAVRVDQVFRRYVPRRQGDLAIIHHRFDGTVVDAATWTPLLAGPKPATYCDGYE